MDRCMLLNFPKIYSWYFYYKRKVLGQSSSVHFWLSFFDFAFVETDANED